MLFSTRLLSRSYIIAAAFLLQSCGDKVAEVVAAGDAVSADCLSVAEPMRFDGDMRRASATGQAYQPNCPPQDEACGAWWSFRRDHPYPYQAFAGKRLGGDRAVLVLSEPPPDLARERVAGLVMSAFADRNPTIAAQPWMIGPDGYVEDVVVSFDAPELQSDDLLGSSDIRDRLGMLNLAWYGTTCGGDVETIGSGSALAPAPAPNLEISAREIRKWLEDPATLWTPIETTAPQRQAWQQLQETGPSGAYLSQDNTLVLLTFPTSLLDSVDGVGGLKQDFRRFAVSSDAILGAVTTQGGQFALIGRGRTHPFSQIAPLRFETFALLAAQKADELSQSYERSNPLAGRMPLAGRDWAPIYLSEALIDTELGALLNVTDQMLKAWSQHGTVEYLYFDYPGRPPNFPFDRPLTDVVHERTGSESVLFNWNTSGSAVVVNTPNFAVLVGRQLGALPVTYGAEIGNTGEMDLGKLMDLEERAYQYFPSLGDPNLARVTQYTLIYQAFRNLAARGGEADRQVPELRNETRVLVDRMQEIVASPESAFAADAEGYSQNAVTAIAGLRANYPTLTDREIATLLLNPMAGLVELERNGRLPISTESELVALNTALSSANEAIQEAWSAARYDLAPIREQYERASARTGTGWIRTPSNVVSWGQGIVGGHNLTARAARVESSSLTETVSVAGGKIEYNPRYAEAAEQHATELARLSEHRGASAEQLQAVLSKPVVDRPRLAALAMDRSPPRPRPGSARLGRQSFSDTEAFLSELRTLKMETPCCRIVARDGSGRSFIVETNAKPPPLTRIAGFGDNASLGMYIKSGKGRPADVIVLGQKQAHVDVLLAGVDGAAQPQGLIGLFRRRLGGSSRGQAAGDHLIAYDLNGRPGSLMAESGSGGRGGMRQLFALRSKTVRNATVQELGAAELQRLTGRFAWDAGRDGMPIAVRVSFPPEAGSRIDGFNVIAGFRRGDPQDNAGRLRSAVGDVVAATRDRDIPLAVVQISIKNSLRGASEAEVGRIIFEIRNGSAATQFTLAPRRRSLSRSG
jgi:hypothetical protein